MRIKLRTWFDELLQKKLQIDGYDKIKLCFLFSSFLFIIGSYSILRSLKSSIFLGFVGREYLPIAKILSVILMIPAMLGYSKLIDKLKRYQVIYFFLTFYAILGILFAYFFAHPVYGLQNTYTSPYRLLGWSFEIFMDLYQAFVVSTFWAFINSISTPNFAKSSYGIIVAGGRIGGIIAAGISYLILDYGIFAHTTSISGLTAAASLLLAGAAFALYKIVQKVPQDELHGYEAAYRVSEQDEKAHKQPGIFEGLRLVLAEPYVLGLFGLVASYEIISIIFDYQMQVLMSIETHNNVHAMSKFMLFYTGSFQALSFFFAILGTTTLLKKISIEKCLLIMPVATIALSLFIASYPSLTTVFIAMVILRALHYGFNSPVREVLFIPTVRDIQFKSKAWIESFGRTFSKSSGSAVNLLSAFQHSCLLVSLETMSTIFIAVGWCIISLLVSKKYIHTITHNLVIGKENE